MKRMAACLLLCVGAIMPQDVAQDVAQEHPRTFQSQAKVVQVPVVVTGKDGKTVVDLTLGDFRVLDNGIPQQATMDDFISGLPPISLAIAIQSSGTSKLALQKIRQIGNMIQPLVTGARGQAAVVTFDKEITWLQDFTRDSGKINGAVKSLTAARPAGARMFDAIAQVADRMRQRPGRRVLLLMSEGHDQGSETKFQQAMEAVEREGIQVFGAHYSSYAMSWISKPEDFPDQGELNEMFFNQLARLATENPVRAMALASGGSDFPFLRERGIEDAIERLGAEVYSQYILSFPQRGDAAGLHQIEITVPNRPGLRVRSRRLYWAD
ncbi:MAG TPA: VWA domain-containing protein [Bryobacteraceae bacterium]|jgi:VWFA-related protein